MDAKALLRINEEEERLLPTELKVKMLMDQAAMRMRASAMVGERISKLDDVIRVRSLLAIIREKSETAQQPAEKQQQQQQQQDIAVKAKTQPAGAEAEAACDGEVSALKPPPPASKGGGVSLEDAAHTAMFARMAVSGLKTVLFQLTEENASEEPKSIVSTINSTINSNGVNKSKSTFNTISSNSIRSNSSKDLFDMYEGLLTTKELGEAAAEGFPLINVDSILSIDHRQYRMLIAARHRFLLRKLGVLLDMKDDLDTLLELAKDSESVFADVDLTSSPVRRRHSRRFSEGAATGTAPSSPPSPVDTDKAEADAEARAEVASTTAVSGASSASRAMSPLRVTSWDKSAINGDTTEDETDEETPQQDPRIAEISPSH